MNHPECPKCGLKAQTEMSGGDLNHYWCGSDDKWQSDTCELYQEIRELRQTLEGVRSYVIRSNPHSLKPIDMDAKELALLVMEKVLGPVEPPEVPPLAPTAGGIVSRLAR